MTREYSTCAHVLMDLATSPWQVPPGALQGEDQAGAARRGRYTQQGNSLPEGQVGGTCSREGQR